jgi:tetratricopeptide (TPR) repeat protein
VHWQQGDLAAARPQFEAYLDVSGRLVEQDPDNLEWRRELSYAHSNLGSLLEAEDDLEGALAHFRATLAIDEELAAAEPASLEARSELAASHNTVGVVLQDLGRLSEAGEHLRAELDLRRSLLAADPTDFQRRDFFGTSHSRLGIHRSLLGDWPSATRHFDQALAVFTALEAHDPANVSWRFKLAWSHLNLGRAAFARGELTEAEASIEAARRIVDELLTRDAPHAWRRTQAVGLYHLALVRLARGRPARAELQDAVRILDELAASRPRDRDVHRWLSQSHVLLGSLEAAPAAARDRFESAEKTISPFARGSRDGRVLAPWAAALRCLGRVAEARLVEAALNAQGYAEPGLDGLCPDPIRRHA